jgi:hypothetical protein
MEPDKYEQPCIENRIVIEKLGLKHRPLAIAEGGFI